LGSYDGKTGALARVPFVGPGPPAGVVAVATAPVLAIADRSGQTVTLRGDASGLAPLRIGVVLGPNGEAIGKVVVTRVLEAGGVADVLDGGDKVVAGASVRFDK